MMLIRLESSRCADPRRRSWRSRLRFYLLLSTWCATRCHTRNSAPSAFFASITNELPRALPNPFEISAMKSKSKRPQPNPYTPIFLVVGLDGSSALQKKFPKLAI